MNLVVMGKVIFGGQACTVVCKPMLTHSQKPGYGVNNTLPLKIRANTGMMTLRHFVAQVGASDGLCHCQVHMQCI